jgi:hypothetical protein
MSPALRLEDVFAFDGRSYFFLEQVATCKDIGYLQHAFDALARLRGPDTPRLWPFDAGFLPTLGEARRAVIAMFWLLEYVTADPLARHRRVDPLEWIRELERVGNAHRKRVAVGSRSLVVKTQRTRTAQRKGGHKGAKTRADWFDGNRDEARKQAKVIWSKTGNEKLTVAAVARLVAADPDDPDFKWETVRRWIADLRPPTW